MDKESRDQLLVRLDERTINIWHVLEKVVQHQETQNGHLADLLKDTAKNSSWRTTSRWIIGGIVSTIGVIWAKILGLF